MVMVERVGQVRSGDQPCRMRWPILSRTVVNACEISGKGSPDRGQKSARLQRRTSPADRTCMILCSFNWISARLTVASGRGRETRDAIAIGSVSRTILNALGTSCASAPGRNIQNAEIRERTHCRWSRRGRGRRGRGSRGWRASRPDAGGGGRRRRRTRRGRTRA